MKKITLALSIGALSFGAVLPSQAANDFSSLFQGVARGDQSSESVYFVMTDRFANGDTSNDQDGFDPTDIGYWHGGDFKGLTSHLQYIKSMGFSAIWITPPVVQQSVQGNSAAYHGYWGLDFMHVDPHLGTEQDFKDFVSGAHALGMKVIIDVVANHTADIIQYSSGNAFIPKGKENAKNPAFLNDITNYHNKGPSTFEGESILNGDFNSLDDINTEKSEVVQGFIEIWSHWINTFDIDGLRIDTFKHVNPEFWHKVIPSIQKVAADKGKKTFPIFGEVYDTSPQVLSTYVATGQTPSVLDFGFNEEVTRYTTSFGQAERLANLFNLDDLYTTSLTSAYGLATFTGNHDMGRVGTAILNNASTREDALKRDLINQAALFFLRGGPVLYYGDEHGMTGAGGDKAARQDMFPTQVSRWTFEQRIGEAPIETKSSFDVTNPIQSEITKIQAVIAANPALRNGTQQTLAAVGQTFVAARYADKQEFIVALNTADKSKSVSISPMAKNGAWNLLAGSCAYKKGMSLTLKANSYCVLKASAQVGKSQTTTLSAPKISDSNDSPLWKQVSITVNKPGYNEVNFMAREVGKDWISLGTADRTTTSSNFTKGGLYRVFLHGDEFAKNVKLEVVAVLKNSDGKMITSSITKVTNK